MDTNIYPINCGFEEENIILVVDDAKSSLELLSESLVKVGFRVQTVKGGDTALAAARSILPNLILLDIMMQDMDGYELCRQLKNDELTRDVPFIIISALDKTVDRVRCFESGGVDFISKPFQVEEVLARVRTHLAMRRMYIKLERQNAELEQKLVDTKKAMNVLQESEQRLFSILENSPAVVYVKDSKGRYILTNRKFESFYRADRGHFLGKKDSDIFPRDVAEKLRQNDQAVFNSDKAMQFEEVVSYNYGDVSYISVKFPLHNINGEVYAICGISSDITDRKQTEIALEKAKDAAEAANRAKSSFLANMSHELRTPLNVILGFSQLLQRDDNLKDSSKKHFESINRSGEHLLRLINSVLEISKIEAGRSSLNHAIIDIYEVLEDIETMFGMQATEKKVRFIISKSENLPRYAVGDEGKLRQVLINLLGNSVKFTEVGKITLRVSLVGSLWLASEKTPQAQRTFLFEVEDTGVGISTAEMQNIFQPFEQAEIGQIKGGTGLGLAISREYARMMGGDLFARSELGKGSLFSLSCRFEVISETLVKKGDRVRKVVGLAPGIGPKAILVVEDEAENRRFLAELLSLVGFATWEAANGKEALAVFKATRPDLVLMDLKMPLMDGYKAIRHLKSMMKLNKIPIIVVSASSLVEEREKIMATGADDIISKPFMENDLFEAIARHLDIQYRYTENKASAAIPCESVRISHEDLMGLPEDVREELRKSLLELNVSAIHGMIDKICTFNRPVGEAMYQLESMLQFETLLNLIK